MASQHLVEKLDLLVEYGSGVADYEQQYQINDYLRDEFLRVVDEVFDELNLKYIHQRIALLNVDLGEIPVTDYRRVMAKRLREQLLEMMAKYRIDQNDGSEHRSSESENDDSFLQLTHYLTHGRMPWHSPYLGRADLDKLIAKVFENCGPRLLALIKTQPASREVERLVYQLNETHFRHLLSEIYHGDIAKLTRLLHGVATLHAEIPLHTLKLILVRWVLAGGASDDDAIAFLFSQTAIKSGRSVAQLIDKAVSAGVIDAGTANTLSSTDKHVDALHYGKRLQQDLLQRHISNIRDYWSMLIAGYEQQIRQVFIDSAAHVEIRDFVANNFTDEMLHQLVKILEPIEYLFIEQTINNGYLFNPSHTEENLPAKILKPQLWALTLHYLLVERGSRFNKISYLQYLIRQSARHHNLDYLSYLSAIYNIISVPGHSTLIKRELVSLLADLIENELGDDQRTTRQESPLSVLKQFADKLCAGRFTMDATQWQLLLAYDAQTIIALLQQYATTSGAIRNLCSSLDQQQLKRLVTIVEPNDYSVIHQLVEQRRLFHEPLADSRVSVDELTCQIWELSFTYLLIDRGSRFNQKSYLNAVFYGLAARHNISYQQLLSSLDHIMSRAQHALSVRSLFYTIIHELYLATVDNRSDPQLIEQIEPFDEVRLYEIYEQLIAYLTGNDRRLFVNGYTPRNVLMQLSKSAPWLLKQLFSVLQDANEVMLKHLANTDDATIELLIEYFFKINAGYNDQFNQLGQAIKHYSGQARERRWFYAKILDALLNNRAIDLQSFSLEPLATHSIDQKTTEDREDDRQFAKSKLLLTHRDYLSFVEHFLLQKITTVSGIKQFMDAINYLITYQAGSLNGVVERAFKDKKSWSRLLSALPDSQLVQLFMTVSSRDLSTLLMFSELMFSVCASSVEDISLTRAKYLKWSFIYRGLFDSTYKVSRATLIKQLKNFLVQEGVTIAEDEWLGRAHDHLRFLPVSERQRYLSVFDQRLDLPDIKKKQAAENKLSMKESRKDIPDEVVPDEDIYIENAGLVIVASYLPRLFTMLNLTDKGKFISPSHAERACHLIQYLVNESCDTPEYQLALNKQLCGISSGTPILREIEIKPEEVEAINGLLLGVIQNWKKIGNTSIAGLRESFLQRPGRLQLDNDAWQLKVQSSAYDMLLDYLPWSFTTIRFPWMKRVIYVDW